MPFDATIEVEDPDFFTALQNPDGLMPYLEKAMDEILTEYKAIAEVYAPESEANRPGRFDKEGKPMGYYERGRGHWYPVMKHATLKQGEIPTIKPHSKSPKTMASTSLLAEGFPGVAGYKLIPNSEQMHDSWSTEIHRTVDGIIGNLRNSASYSGYVQGLLQIPLHKLRGWKTVMENWEDDKLQDLIQEATSRAIDAFYGGG